MKNKKNFLKIFYFFILFFNFTFVLSDEFKFKAKTIETFDKGNLIRGFGGVEINDSKDLILTGEEFEFDKLKSLLNIKNNVLIEDNLNNNTIRSNQIVFNRKLNIYYSVDYIALL